MGTYTTNKELFMPSVGEQGWGTLVNNNFSIIDTLLKPITVSGSTYTFTGNHVGNQSGGSISATSITNSGTSTFTGKITANGGIETKALTATSISNSGTLTQTGTSTFTGKITANGGVNDYEARITALEAGEFENALCTISTDSDVLGGLYFDTSKKLVSSDNNGVTKTYTYRRNPLCNTVQFSTSAYASGGKANVKVNGTVVATSSSTGYAYVYDTSDPITLNDGDTIVAYAYGIYNSGGACSCNIVYRMCLVSA